jgi:hypothetical protein
MSRFLVGIMLVVTWGILLHLLLALRFTVPPREWPPINKAGFWFGQLLLPCAIVALYATATYIILEAI